MFRSDDSDVCSGRQVERKQIQIENGPAKQDRRGVWVCVGLLVMGGWGGGWGE